MKENNNLFLLDTSSLLTYIEDEEGSDIVNNLLIESENEQIIIFVSFISLVEIFYITIQEKGEEEAIERIKMIKSLAVEMIESNETFSLKAGRLKAQNKISFADAYIAATSIELGSILVHKDPEFEKIKPYLKQIKLPYKTISLR